MNIIWNPLSDDMWSWDEGCNGGPLGGDFQSGMRWDGYLARCYPDMRPRFEAVPPEILARHVFQSGEWHQDPEQPCTPQFDDGKFVYVSVGAWREFMAAIWSTQDGIDCDFAWDVPDHEGSRTQKLVSFEDMIAGVRARMPVEFTAKLEPANDDDPFEGEFLAKVAREDE